MAQAPRITIKRKLILPSQVVTPSGNWPTMLAFMQDRFPQIPALGWQQRFTQEQVCDAGGQPLQINTPFRSQQRIVYQRTVDNEIVVPFDVRVVFEDELILIADKPHFLPTVPSGQYVEQTLLHRLQACTSNPDLSPAHRLDRETAGLVLLIKNAVHRGAYQQLFASNQINKTYHAVAPLNKKLAFPLTHECRIIESPRFMQMEVVAGPANSRTHIAIMQSVSAENHLFCLRPATGKKHQLRLHMASLGMPIVGDQIYPTLQPFVKASEQQWDKPLQLLAQGLQFNDPITKLERTFTSTQQLAKSTTEN